MVRCRCHCRGVPFPFTRWLSPRTAESITSSVTSVKSTWRRCWPLTRKDVAWFLLPCSAYLLRSTSVQRCRHSILVPHLSCWERHMEGVDEGTERSEAGLDRLDMRRREQMQPGQEQTGTDVGLEQEPQVV